MKDEGDSIFIFLLKIDRGFHTEFFVRGAKSQDYNKYGSASWLETQSVCLSGHWQWAHLFPCKGGGGLVRPLPRLSVQGVKACTLRKPAMIKQFAVGKGSVTTIKRNPRYSYLDTLIQPFLLFHRHQLSTTRRLASKLLQQNSIAWHALFIQGVLS